MKTYNIAEFEWFVAMPKNKWGINFLRTDCFTLNAALCSELSKNIEIGFHPTEKVICLRKGKDGEGIRLPSSGMLKSKELIERIMAAGIHPPVHLNVYKQDELWIAIPDEKPVTVKVNLNNPPKKPRKLNMDLLKKEASRI